VTTGMESARRSFAKLPSMALTACFCFAPVLAALPEEAKIPASVGHSQKPFDAAVAFGSREDVTGLRLSPDGRGMQPCNPRSLSQDSSRRWSPLHR
jgi:hypothetical protein